MTTRNNDRPCNCLALTYNTGHRQGNKAAPITWEQQDMSNKTQAAQDKAEAIAKLSDMVKPGDTVYTVLRHVTASGMRRSIDAYIIRNNEPVWLSYWAGKALGYKTDNKHGGLILNGCGTDMGFEFVYNLSAVVFSGDDRSGYILNHRWL